MMDQLQEHGGNADAIVRSAAVDAARTPEGRPQ